MDRELLFLGQIFIDFFTSLFSMETPKKSQEVVGILDPDSAGHNLPLGEEDEYIRRQVEAGQN